MSPGQCKAARFLLGWTQRDLSTASDVSHMTVMRFEQGHSVRKAMLRAIAQSLADAGIQFHAEAGQRGVPRVTLEDGTGVSLMKKDGL